MASGGGVRMGLIGALAALLAVAAAPAWAQAPDCKALARRIADFDKRANSALAERYERAARKQRDEIDRTINYGEQSGCWAGDAEDGAPAMCRQLDARLARMRANLDDLEARAGQAAREGDAGETRESLAYDYDLWCRGLDRPTTSARPPLGRIPDDEAVRIDGVPIPDSRPGAELIIPDARAGGDLTIRDAGSPPPGGEVDAGAVALCVRVCDGGYFPLSAPVRTGRTEGLQPLCSAQCPGTPARVYLSRKGEDVSKAVALNGDFYAALPNAFRFRKKYDPACACKPADKNWGQVLTEAERLLQSETGKADAAIPANGLPKLPLRGGDADAASSPAKPRAGAAKAPAKPGEAAPAAPPAPAAGAAPESGAYREVIGPDGVKRRIRIVGPQQ